MRYVRLHPGPDGERHFEDVAIEFHSSSPYLPNLPPYAALAPKLADRVLVISFPPGWRSEHNTLQRQFLVTLAGSAGLWTSDGETRYFHAGDVCLAEDTTGKGHTRWTIGDDPCSRW
jgi:hypothetical protein